MKNSTVKDDTESRSTELREEACLTVNDPFRGGQFVANKKLTPEELSRLEEAIAEDEKLRFAVVGDLNAKNRYARCVLAVTDRQIYGLDETFDGGVKVHSFDKLKRAYVKRCYGNALLIFSGEENKVNFLRFSYREAPIFDAAAAFITNAAGGADEEEELHTVEASMKSSSGFAPNAAVP